MNMIAFYDIEVSEVSIARACRRDTNWILETDAYANLLIQLSRPSGIKPVFPP